MKTKQDVARQVDTAGAEEALAASQLASTIALADVVANDQFSGHGGSYVFDAASGLRTRADADAGAAVEVAQ